jgi:hypothetical protein
MDSHPRTTPLSPLSLRAGQPERPPSRVASRVSRVAAWARLEDELRSIAIDLLGPNESDEFHGACADWVAAASEAAASTVCDSALDALVQCLDSLLIDVPPDVARRLDQARVRHDAGFA